LNDVGYDKDTGNSGSDGSGSSSNGDISIDPVPPIDKEVKRPLTKNAEDEREN